ncbi:DUF1014-domain-containing protein [Tilletiopsis washingtonensis]|uniref:DUF1014-domain-containing protein n=1 Tax=Tilletiopsis washingtonensis TaxID=58919 RepID=A0A316ZGY4_9BASI|nr:DUF1014-domain-containing protein [Tilletiopsis washingtonensis]PWO00285.1 DUF1014-domain-containing protein [Tilletiopsis washingtonensis]
MPPKGGKAKGGAAQKAEAAASKAAAEAAAAEAAEAAAWDKGAKGKSAADAKAEKAAEAARKKAEKERLLAEEEASLPSKPLKKESKKAVQKEKAYVPPPGTGLDDAVKSFGADNIDDMIDAMSLATERTDKAAVGSKAGAIERHPERRYKAAFEAFKEREMPRIKAERPGLRNNQYENELHDEFKKHPDNPFNQLTVAYDATKEEKLEALAAKKAEKEKRLLA